MRYLTNKVSVGAGLKWLIGKLRETGPDPWDTGN